MSSIRVDPLPRPLPELEDVHNSDLRHGEEVGRQSRRRLSGFLLAMGTLHFVAPKQFDQIIPSWVPGSRRFWTYLSGVAELASGALLASRRTKRAGGYCAAATFVAVYPANVQMAMDNKPSTAYGIGLWLRLPMQFPMIAWALRQTRR